MPEYYQYLCISDWGDYLSNCQITLIQPYGLRGFGEHPNAGVYGGRGAPEYSREIIQAPPESTGRLKAARGLLKSSVIKDLRQARVGGGWGRGLAQMNGAEVCL